VRRKLYTTKVRVLIVLTTILFICNIGYGQLYQGPATGTVPNGVTVNTGTEMQKVIGEPLPPYIKLKPRNKLPVEKYPDYLNKTNPSAPEGSNYKIDPNINRGNINTDNEPILVKSFQGFLDPGSYIPPDPYIAAGPTHIMCVDNSRFRIFDKSGVLVKSILADGWFRTVLTGASVFDPKVTYDHLSKRWIMVWLHVDDVNQKSYFLLSVSADSIPLGTWYNWCLSSDVNGGTPSGNWADYEGVGFDDKAIYFTSNQFQYNGGFRGSKIRIIEKSQLYNNTAGQVTWIDLWDLREPANFSVRTFGVRPAIHITTSGDYYLLCTSPYQTGTFFTLYKISDPTNNPVMSAVNIPVTQYSSPGGANQLGGGSPLIETGGAGLLNEPKYKNGYIWGVHQIRSGTGNAYSSVRYLKIDVNTNATAEDAAMGADGYWHFYPAITLDKDDNAGITYSRSGLTEYIGGYYTARLNTVPNTFIGSYTLQVGKSNYVKTFGSGRNRWGDYNGIWFDPSDMNNFWMIAEYAETPANTWAAQVGMMRLTPFPGRYLTTDKDSLNFGVCEINTASDTLKFRIYNYGADTLVINSIQINNNQFILTGSLQFPINIGFKGYRDFEMLYKPTSTGKVIDSLRIISNASNIPLKNIYLSSKGYKINPASGNVIFAVTGTQSNGALLALNDTNGAGSIIGNTGYPELKGISIRPSDKTIFACYPTSSTTKIVRINAEEGDAYPYFDLPIFSVTSISFDLNDELYCSKSDGSLYKFNLITKDTNYIGNTGIPSLFSIAVNPINGQMWGLSLSNKIFKIDKATAQSTQIGIPGFTITPSIAFDKKGNLYGISGTGSQEGYLIKYDTAAGTATVIGNTGYKGVNAIAISSATDIITPVVYQLYQNYPNPFNPSTTIKFDIPVSSHVKIKIYDMLGREIVVLVNGQFPAGTHSVIWNSMGYASGIYFYKIETTCPENSGKGYKAFKKMVFLR